MPNFTFDGSINAGQILTGLIFLFGCGVVWGTTSRRLKEVQKDVSGVQEEIKKLTEITISNAARDEREKALAARLDRLERQLEIMQNK